MVAQIFKTMKPYEYAVWRQVMGITKKKQTEGQRSKAARKGGLVRAKQIANKPELPPERSYRKKVEDYDSKR